MEAILHRPLSEQRSDTLSSDWRLAQRLPDEWAFQQLYTDHRDFAYRLALGVLGNPAMAEDATQEAFIKLWKHAGKAKAQASFRAWFAKVTLNVARDLARRERRRITEELPETLAHHEQAQGDATIDELRRALRGLSGRQREVFVLRVLEGYSEAEAATICGLRKGTVKVHLHRAMQGMRAFWEQQA